MRDGYSIGGRSLSDRLAQLLGGDVEHRLDRVDLTISLLLALFLLCSAFSIALTQIGYFSALIIWVGRMVYRRQSSIPSTPLDRFFLAYAVAETLATVFAYNKSQSLLYMQRRLLLIPIVYILFANIRSTRQLKVLVAALFSSALFVAVWSLRDFFAHVSEYLLFQRRLEEFQIYMTAGGIMMIAMLLILPFTIHPKTPFKIRLAAILVMLPLAVNLLFTFTRSSWLGFLAGAFVIGTLRARKIFPILFGVVVIVVMISSPAMKERVYSTFEPHHPNNISRLHMWQTGWKMFLDHPIVGIGDIGTEQLWDRYAEPDWQPEGHLHNNLVMWLTTLGLLGFAALSALFIRVWLVMAKAERRTHENWFLGSVALGGLAVMAGFHINGLFEWNFGDAEIIMLVWATVGLTMACGKLAEVQEAS